MEMILAKKFEGELWIKAEHHHQAVKQAVEVEREACAKVCDKKMENHGWDEYIDDIADEIRARGQE